MGSSSRFTAFRRRGWSVSSRTSTMTGSGGDVYSSFLLDQRGGAINVSPVEVHSLPLEAIRTSRHRPLESFGLAPHSLPAPEHFGVSHARDSAQLGA